MIEFLGREIPLYGIMCVLGILAAICVAFAIIKKRQIDTFDFACAAAFILIGAFLGAKILFVVISWKQIIALRLSFLEIMRGGFVFYGGLIGGFLGMVIYVKAFKCNFKDYFDICATVLPLGHGFGRIGCFLGGCCYGMEYDGCISYTYTESLNVATPIGVPLLPIQLIEGACLFVLFGITLFIFLKKDRTFDTFIVYIVGYAALRFVLEFFRGDKERGLLLLSTSQWISVLLLFAVGIYAIIRWKKKCVKNKK